MPGRLPARVLVTGGAGFIGSHLVAALRKAGREVVVFDDLSSGSVANLPSDVPLVQMDVADPAIVPLIADAAPGLVIHAAAQVSVPRSMADPDRDRAVNLIGTQHVLEGARMAGAKRFVFISSGGAVYGEASNADEGDAPAPASYYGLHKYAAEGYVRLSAMSHGIVRLPNIYGPRQRSDLEGGVVAIFIESLLASRPITMFGDGAQVRDFLHVEDAVAGILTVAAAGADGTWNVATGRATSINELLAHLQRLVGVHVAVQRAPARAGDVRNSSLAIRRIVADLGWMPRYELGEGLAQTLAEGRRSG